MAAYKKASGSMTALSTLKRKASGVATNIAHGYRRSGGAWTLVYTYVKAVINDQSLINSAVGTAARVGYRLNSSGIAEQRSDTSYTTLETWLQQGTNSQFECYASVNSTSGTGSNTGTFGTWLALSSSQEWSVLCTPSAGVYTVVITVQIREAGTGIVLDSAIITLESDRS